MKVTHYSPTGAQSQVTLNDSVFGAPVNPVLLSQALRVYLSNLRQGTSKVKTRSEVNRTKKKWFKQKGTGNARHGARTANIFVGGGVSHGPNGMQNWTKALTRDMKHKALMSAFSAQSKNVVIHEGLTQLKGKTAEAATLLNGVAAEANKILVIVGEYTQALLRSLRNLENVLLVSADRVNALEVANADKIILTPDAVTVLEQRLNQVQGAPKAKTESAPKAANPPAGGEKATKPAAKVAQPVTKAAAKKAPAKPAAKSAPKTTKKVTKAKEAK